MLRRSADRWRGMGASAPLFVDAFGITAAGDCGALGKGRSVAPGRCAGQRLRRRFSGAPIDTRRAGKHMNDVLRDCSLTQWQAGAAGRNRGSDRQRRSPCMPKPAWPGRIAIGASNRKDCRPDEQRVDCHEAPVPPRRELVTVRPAILQPGDDRPNHRDNRHGQQGGRQHERQPSTYTGDRRCGCGVLDEAAMIRCVMAPRTGRPAHRWNSRGPAHACGQNRCLLRQGQPDRKGLVFGSAMPATATAHFSGSTGIILVGTGQRAPRTRCQPIRGTT